MASTIVTCPNCGKRNRLRPTPEGVPRCAVCQTVLPWIVDADDTDYDEELTTSVPVLVDFWAPWCGPERYGIRGIPTLMTVRNGQEVDRLAGAAAKPQLDAWLDRQLAGV